MFCVPCRSRAIAVVTQESIPPLSSTTARLESLIFSSLEVTCWAHYGVTSLFRLIHAFRRWIPNKLVQLQSQPHRQAIRQDPFRQLARLEPGPFSLWIFKHGRKENFSYTPCQRVLLREFARKFVIPPRRK